MTDKISALYIIDLAVITLRNIVIFPGEIIQISLNKEKCVFALEKAPEDDYKIFVVTQKDGDIEDPDFDDLYSTGVICEIVDIQETYENSDESVITLKGMYRAEIEEFASSKPLPISKVKVSETFPFKSDFDGGEKFLCDFLKSLYNEYEGYFTHYASKRSLSVMNINSLGRLCDSIAFNSHFSTDNKQTVLSENDILARAQQLAKILKSDIELLKIESDIQFKVQDAIDQNQREYYLREEMKVISEELGHTDSPAEEADEYFEKISKLKCSFEIKTKLFNEAKKLMKIPDGSHEGTVVRCYLDKCLEIPFGKYSKDTIDLEKSRRILEKEHYALNEVKDRIIEALAVYKRNPGFTGQILCLFGPPGVGKTSIVKSLAKSMNRKYVRISLGGICDEAEIRGHRRTYIGAMAGRIVEALIKAGTMNPVILLDEIDKVGQDYKGDPASALLEALDPEQNNSFHDHYIDFPIDLSKVMFITTANDVHTINPALSDRMEIIEINSYTFVEKFHIAKEFLYKKQIKKHGLKAREFKITDKAYNVIIENYTQEAGVRSLEKKIASLCRKAVLKLENGEKTVKITEDNISDYLGAPKFKSEAICKGNAVGVINALAWTPTGGVILPIEVSSLDGSGQLVLTGNIGDVMKESAQTAFSYIRSNSDYFGIDKKFYTDTDIHIHAIEGGVPKDGPSAGLAITAAIVSELTNVPIKSDVAITGEMTLKGRALPIGGLREKGTAAYKSNCKSVIIPEDNMKDLDNISDEVKNNLNFIPVNDFKEVPKYLFEKGPVS